MNEICIPDHNGENAIIFLPNNELDDDTKKLVSKLAQCNVFHHIQVMPDCHSSINCCVGFTSEIRDKVIPRIVGGDIGCGISCYPLNKKIKVNQYKKIDQEVKNIIPIGSKIHIKSIATDDIMNDIYNE